MAGDFVDPFLQEGVPGPHASATNSLTVDDQQPQRTSSIFGDRGGPRRSMFDGAMPSHVSTAGVLGVGPVAPQKQEQQEQQEVAPFHGLTATFASMDAFNAGDMLCLITADVGPAGGFSLASQMKGSLRAEIRQWVDHLRKRNLTASGQLRSLGPRDEAVDSLSQKLIEQASKTKTGVWTAALPTGRQIALVRQDVFDSVGMDQVVRAIHHQAIRLAVLNGDPYNEAALHSYEASRPEAASVGAH